MAVVGPAVGHRSHSATVAISAPTTPTAISTAERHEREREPPLELFGEVAGGVPCLHLRDVCDEAIAVPRDGRDEPLLTRGISQGLPHHEHVLCEVRLLDGGVRPQPAHQFVLRDYSPMLLDEDEERVERLRLDRHRLAVVQQLMSSNVDAKAIEVVEIHRPQRIRPR